MLIFNTSGFDSKKKIISRLRGYHGATIISGSCDFAVTDWGPSPCVPPGAPVAATASATFNFDNTVITIPGPPVPIVDVLSDFGASAALFSYGPGDSLGLVFVTPLNSLFAFNFGAASTAL